MGRTIPGSLNTDGVIYKQAEKNHRLGLTHNVNTCYPLSQTWPLVNLHSNP